MLCDRCGRATHVLQTVPGREEQAISAALYFQRHCIDTSAVLRLQGRREFGLLYLQYCDNIVTHLVPEQGLVDLDEHLVEGKPCNRTGDDPANCG